MMCWDDGKPQAPPARAHPQKMENEAEQEEALHFCCQLLHWSEAELAPETQDHNDVEHFPSESSHM